ncbi:aldehyde dehydrogenase [Prauserella muralis]|uniref:aldehyde dehydrogenase (NAD(+)) n=1 Tax=Prauserella muralis TaxID=588067 RepID=A0A2V4AIA2_9PSEU|nr:aldehyde dehydrogenase [Prauserella muralis]
MAGNEPIEVENPATEERIGTVHCADPALVDAAVTAAREAFAEWSQTPRADRAKVLGALSSLIGDREEELAQTITRDVGSPITLARRIQAALPKADVDACRAVLDEPEAQEWIGHSQVVREPAGVVAAVTPWNYPLHQAVLKIAPAIAAGCTVVLKPSEVAPLATEALMDLLVAAGVPHGVVNLVHGTGSSVGEALVGHPGIDVVSFTGSTGAGRRVAALAAATPAKVVLELGGKSASVVLDDADLTAAVKVTVANCYLNGGQTCSAWTRLIVPRHRHDEAVDIAAAQAARFAPGDPTDPAARLGPLVSSAQRERVLGMVRAAVADGTRLAFGRTDGGSLPDRGHFVTPVVFSGVDPTARIAQEEVFGPVLVIIPVDGEEEAVAAANAVPYGLHGAVWSADEGRAVAVAARMRTGQVDLNGAAHNPAAPFGGVGASGLGRESGAYGIAEYTTTKAIQFPAGRAS